MSQIPGGLQRYHTPPIPTADTHPFSPTTLRRQFTMINPVYGIFNRYSTSSG